MDATKNENGEWEYTRILSEEEARDNLRLIRQEDLEESDVWALPDRYNSLTTEQKTELDTCLLYTSPSPRDLSTSRMPSSA